MARNSMLTPVTQGKPRKKPKANDGKKDEAFSRNFTKRGVPKLSAQSGSGSMGQRR